MSGMWQKFWSRIPESSRKSFSFYDMAPNFLRVMDAVWLRYLARVLSSATFTLFIIDSSSTLDLHKKVVAISVFSKVGILTFGRECFECAMETKLFRPIGNSTEIFVICGRRVKNTHDGCQGRRTDISSGNSLGIKNSLSCLLFCRIKEKGRPRRRGSFIFPIQ